MTKFKIGDRVRRICGFGPTFSDKRKVYTVERVVNYLKSQDISFVDINNPSYPLMWNSENFELVSENFQLGKKYQLGSCQALHTCVAFHHESKEPILQRSDGRVFIVHSTDYEKWEEYAEPVAKPKATESEAAHLVLKLEPGIKFVAKDVLTGKSYDFMTEKWSK